MELDINIHPADELAAVREEIRLLTQREDALKAHFLAEGADLEGQHTRISIVTSVRETVDKAAMIAELGKDVVDPFLKKSTSRSVRVLPK